MNNKKFNDYLLDILYSLEGKINKTEFKKIIKHYKWKFNFKSIHIVGTNGKGSNAKYINDELIYQNKKVGLFTSPHINDMYERIMINNQKIEFETMSKFVTRLKSDFPNINFGWFDVFFLTALHWFCSKNIDVAIFEAGIGAKKDIVNYIKHDIVLITSIDLDHTKILGNTKEKIAIDKSFAIKNNNQKIYISNDIDENIIDIFKKRANDVGAKLKVVKVNKKTYETKNISLSKNVLKNEFNIKNFKSFFVLPIGRSQQIKINNIMCGVDVAHNYQGIIESINYFKINKIKFDQIVVSLSSDKDHKKILRFLSKEFKIVYVYENKGRKPLKLSQYNEKFPKILNLSFFIKKLDCSTLFIGSFYLVSEIFEIIK